MSKLFAEQLCHVITFGVPGGHIGEDGVREVALRPVLGNPCVLSEDLSCGYVALDETALVDGVGGCLQRLGVGRGPGEEAGEAKGGEDERQEKEGNEECETQA